MGSSKTILLSVLIVTLLISVNIAQATPPSFLITEPSYEWVNSNSFTVSWEAADGDGVQCSNVLWSDDAWNPLWETGMSWDFIDNEVDPVTDCTSGSGSVIFGPTKPIAVTEGVTYYFTGNATDNLGETGNWIYPVNVTADLSPPDNYYTTTDQDGNVIVGGQVLADVNQIVIYSNATDSVSGIKNNTISYWLTQNNQITFGQQVCGEGPLWGGWSNCTLVFGYDENTVIKYIVESYDRAGNVNKSDYMFTTTHPLVNFAIHRSYISLGDSTLLKLFVRNIQEEPDNVTVALSSNFVSPKPTFENTGTGYNISGQGRVLTVLNLNPMEERVFFVRVYSSEIGKYDITLDAISTIRSDIIDDDMSYVQIDYPASFPGLSDFAIFVLIALSVVFFIGYQKKTEL
jgi:hypothetical protein